MHAGAGRHVAPAPFWRAVAARELVVERAQLQVRAGDVGAHVLKQKNQNTLNKYISC